MKRLASAIDHQPESAEAAGKTASVIAPTINQILEDSLEELYAADRALAVAFELLGHPRKSLEPAGRSVCSR